MGVGTVLADTRRPLVLATLLLAGLLTGWAPEARAETLRYAIDIPDGQAVTYRIDLDVRHPGLLTVHADWKGSRSLSLRLTPPQTPTGAVHRVGPSPQSVQVVAEDIGDWTLRVHALAADGGGTGTLTIELPEAKPPGPPVPAGPGEPQPEAAPELEPWMQPQALPAGMPRDWIPFLRSTETLRQTVVGDPPAPPEDACQWQVGLVRYLDRQRDGMTRDGAPLAESTAKLLGRMARAVRSVDELRDSKDPLVAGPAPRDPAMFEAWRKLRTTKFDPVESELDSILSMLRREFAPELDQEDWPIRYVSCLTACERYFEQRVRVGEPKARNRELALSQWSTILAAGEALEALSELHPTDRAARGSASR